MSNYTVKRGDGWYKIAKNLGVNVNDLLKANNATLDTMIHPGLILKSSNKLVAKSDKLYKHMNGLLMDWKSYGDELLALLNEFKNKFITPTLQKVEKMSKLADKEINRYNSRKKQLLTKHKNDLTPLNTYKNKADISKLLDLLYSLGYLKESYNRAVDGVWGKATLAAYDAAVNDGIFNKKSKVAALDTNKNSSNQNNLEISKSSSITWQPSKTSGSVKNNKAYSYKNGLWCDEHNCSRWANDALRLFKDDSNNYVYSTEDVGDHAWRRLSVGKDTKILFNGFNGLKSRDSANFPGLAAANKRNQEAADNYKNTFNHTDLDTDEVYAVNMYYKNSPASREAWTDGLDEITGTHTGNVFYNKDLNKWQVAHNIHGNVVVDDYDKILGSGKQYGITAIAHIPKLSSISIDNISRRTAPILALAWLGIKGLFKHGGNIQKFLSGKNILPEVTVTSLDPNKAPTNIGKLFVKDINSNRNIMMQRYNLSDNDWALLSKTAANIASRDSDMGGSYRYPLKKGLYDLLGDSVYTNMVKGLHYARGIMLNGDISGKDSVTTPSVGLTELKINYDKLKHPELKEEYNHFGITQQGVMNNTSDSAKATLIRLNHGYNKLGLKNKDYHYKDGKIIPKDVGLALWHNFGKLTDNANTNPKELESSVFPELSGFRTSLLYNKKYLDKKIYQ